MSVTSYPTLRLKLTMPQALKLQFLPAIPGTNAAAAAAEAIAAAEQAQTAADTAVAATADKVSKSGDVMSGFLTLNANPNTNLQAATKQYVDAHASGIQTINSQDGPAVTLVAGTNITIDSPAADQIRIAAGAAGIPDAPSDGSLYGRFNATWAQAQPLDADLTSLAGASATNQWYYRSAANTWSPVTVGATMTFVGGVLNTTAGGGNVIATGTPLVGQWARWTSAATIEGVDAASTGFQPLDADLTSLAAASATNVIYYRSAANTWGPITVGTGLTFTGGTLAATGGGGSGNVSNSGTPTVGQYAKWLTATTIQGVAPAMVLSDIGAAPVGAEYITSVADATLTAERVLTDTATVTWDRTVAGQIKANAAGGRQPLNINSGMMVAQEFGGVLQSGLANTSLWSVDGFQFATVNDGVFSSQQLAVATPGGSLNRLAIGVTTADATIAAGQYAFLRAAIEGYDAARLGWGTAAAKPIVVRLGVRPPVAGTFTLTIQNAVSNRNYLVPITFSAGEIGTDVTRYITIPGDTSGTWDTTNGIGLYVLFVLAIGTTYQGSASAWQAGNLFGVSGMSNGIGAVGTWHFFDWAIYDATGLASGVAPPFECPIYSAELLRCRRRFVYETALGWLYVDGVVASTSTYLTIPVRLDQPMRAMPTLTLPAITLANVSAPIVSGLSVSGFTLLAQSTSSVVTRGYYIYASGALKLDARF